MNLIDYYTILKKGVSYFIILLALSCTDSENHSPNELEILLNNFHIRHSQMNKLEKGSELLISKDLNSEFKGLFYKIKDTDEFYFSYMDNNKNIVKAIKLKGKETVSIFNNNQCFVLFDKKKKSIIPKKDDDCFTIFIGEIPYSGYSNIELEWNCSNKSVTKEKLIDGKYFFFFKEGVGDNICNIKLIDKEGKTANVLYDPESGLFRKKLQPTSVNSK